MKSWINKQFPELINSYSKQNKTEYLLIDVNYVFDSIIQEQANLNQDQIINNILDAIENLIQVIQPQKLVYMCQEGELPMFLQNHKKQKFQQQLFTNEIQPNSINPLLLHPYSELSENLIICIHQFIANKQENQLQHLSLIYSSTNEKNSCHTKILQFLTSQESIIINSNIVVFQSIENTLDQLFLTQMNITAAFYQNNENNLRISEIQLAKVRNKILNDFGVMQQQKQIQTRILTDFQFIYSMMFDKQFIAIPFLYNSRKNYERLYYILQNHFQNVIQIFSKTDLSFSQKLIQNFGYSDDINKNFAINIKSVNLIDFQALKTILLYFNEQVNQQLISIDILQLTKTANNLKTKVINNGNICQNENALEQLKNNQDQNVLNVQIQEFKTKQTNQNYEFKQFYTETDVQVDEKVIIYQNMNYLQLIIVQTHAIFNLNQNSYDTFYFKYISAPKTFQLQQFLNKYDAKQLNDLYLKLDNSISQKQALVTAANANSIIHYLIRILPKQSFITLFPGIKGQLNNLSYSIFVQIDFQVIINECQCIISKHDFEQWYCTQESDLTEKIIQIIAKQPEQYFYLTYINTEQSKCIQINYLNMKQGYALNQINQSTSQKTIGSLDSQMITTENGTGFKFSNSQYLLNATYMPISPNQFFVVGDKFQFAFNPISIIQNTRTNLSTDKYIQEQLAMYAQALKQQKKTKFDTQILLEEKEKQLKKYATYSIYQLLVNCKIQGSETVINQSVCCQVDINYTNREESSQYTDKQHYEYVKTEYKSNMDIDHIKELFDGISIRFLSNESIIHNNQNSNNNKKNTVFVPSLNCYLDYQYLKDETALGKYVNID